jgi:hypothetical protein
MKEKERKEKERRGKGLCDEFLLKEGEETVEEGGGEGEGEFVEGIREVLLEGREFVDEAFLGDLEGLFGVLLVDLVLKDMDISLSLLLVELVLLLGFGVLLQFEFHGLEGVLVVH